MPPATHSDFSQTYTIDNIGIIANFVLPFNCSFLLHWQHVIWVNMKLDISGCNKITFQGCRLHWFSYFLMTQRKWSWQCWHSCIVESLWKTLLWLVSNSLFSPTALEKNVFCACVWLSFNPIRPTLFNSYNSCNQVYNLKKKTTEITYQIKLFWCQTSCNLIASNLICLEVKTVISN